MQDSSSRAQHEPVEPPLPGAGPGRRISIESAVGAGAHDLPPSAHSPRPHPPVEEPEEQPDEHAPETSPDDRDTQTPSDPQRRPPRPGKSPR